MEWGTLPLSSLCARLLLLFSVASARLPPNSRHLAPPSTYAFEVFGNLRAVTLPNGTRIEYVFHGQNERIGKPVLSEVRGKVNGTLV